MQKHSPQYLRVIKKRFARKLRDQGFLRGQKRLIMAWIDQNMHTAVLRHNYQQFTAKKFRKYRFQFQRLRHSDIITKIIRQWETLQLEQKLGLQYEEDALPRDSDWSQDQVETKAKKIVRRKKKRFVRPLLLNNRQRIKRFRDKKVRIFYQKNIVNPDDEQIFRVDQTLAYQACAVRPWPHGMFDEDSFDQKQKQLEDAWHQGQKKMFQRERKQKQEQDLKQKMQLQRQQRIMEEKQKMRNKIEYNLRQKQMRQMQMKEEKEARMKQQNQKTLKTWQMKPIDYWGLPTTCYICWKNGLKKNHQCLSGVKPQKYLANSQVISVPGYISLGRRNGTALFYDIQQNKIICNNSTQIPKKQQDSPSYVCRPHQLPAFIPPKIVCVKYYVPHRVIHVRGVNYNDYVNTFPIQFTEQILKFPLAELQDTQKMFQQVPQYSTDILRGKQRIQFANQIQKNDIFGPVGGDIVPISVSNEHAIPFNKKYCLLPLLGATLLSFSSMGEKPNVKLIGTVRLQGQKMVVQMYFRALVRIFPGQYIRA